MRDAIKAECPSAEVTGGEGRRTSFEVTVNGKLVYSKLQHGAFPSGEELVAHCRAVAEKGESALPVNPSKSSCALVSQSINQSIASKM